MQQPARAALATTAREPAQRVPGRVGGRQILAACTVPIGQARAAQVGTVSTSLFLRRDLPSKPTPRRLFK